MDDRPRKDRLIQTRVPQDLESTLKDEARKRRLSVSHLIRNVLEDTFSLVDNVVTEVDRVVTDSVEMAQTLKRDAQRLAATARGHTAHRERRADSSADAASPSSGVDESVPGAIEDATIELAAGAHAGAASDFRAQAGDAPQEPAEATPVQPASAQVQDEESHASPRASLSVNDAADGVRTEVSALGASPLADVYGFQELLLNRPASCANCGSVIARGARAYLGMVDKPGLPRVWVCQDCLDTLSE